MDKRIAIIGAGAAGIAAATKLYENGFHNFVVLEAEDRIGGRIKTIPFGENVLDMGAQWCHGETGNAVFQLAKPHGLLERSRNTDDQGMEFRRSNGESIDLNITERLDKLTFGISYDSAGYKSYSGSYGDYMLEKYEKELEDNVDLQNIDREVSREYIQTFQHYVNAMNASHSWFDLSSNMEFEYCEGARRLNWKTRGYKTVLNLLMKKLPNPELALPIDDKILVNKRVVRIEWNDKLKDKTVILCLDGSSYTVDHVIITVSLGVLKESMLNLFYPPLPLTKQRAIKALGFGVVDKIFMEFNEPFWPQNWKGFALLWRAEDLEPMKKLHGDWIGDIFGIYTVDHQPNLLLTRLSGTKAMEVEGLNKEKLKVGLVAILKSFLMEYNMTEPVNVMMSDWYTNDQFRGSYSHRSVKTEEFGVSASDLAEPVKTVDGDLVLQFAGEASHSTAYSTVNGAVETGWREAERIADFYKA